MKEAGATATSFRAAGRQRERSSVTSIIGPAVIVAAAGIGASDIIAASVAGARFGVILIWAIIVGAAIKGLLAEGIARWQQGSGTTVIQGVAAHLPRGVLYMFAVYLAIWMIGVSAALANGCGLAIQTLTSGRVAKSWGALAHVLFAAMIVRSGGLAGFTKWMKALIAVMFFTIVVCALWTFPEPRSVLGGIMPTMPKGTAPYVLSLIGGIGGSVTLLAYNYVPIPKEQTGKFSRMRFDIIVAYTFTALFGISIVLIATRVFYVTSTPITDADAVSKMAALLGSTIGSAGFYTYLAGFWAAVTASLLAVWQTIPLLAAECYALLRGVSFREHLQVVSPRSRPYAFGVGLLTVSGALFAFAPRPLTIIVAYTILGSFFVPFVAVVLLHLNTRVVWSGAAVRNSRVVNVLLALVLVVFLLIAGREVIEQLAALK